MKKRVIAITGHAGSGKDTLADILVKEYKFIKISLADPLKRFCREVYNFSDDQLWGPSSERNKPDFRYKAVCEKCLGTKLLSKGMLGYYDCSACERRGFNYLTPRKALQMLGTEWGRSLYPDTWVDYTLRIADRIIKEGDLYDAKTGPIARWWDGPESSTTRGIIIPDARFLNEIKKIKAYGGVVIKLQRPGVMGLEALQAGVANHASETEQDKIPDLEFDYILRVEEGLDKFSNQTKALIASIIGE